MSGLWRHGLATAIAAAIALTAASTGSAVPAEGTQIRASAEVLGYEAAPLATAWPDDTTYGPWYLLHDGFGETSVVPEGSGRALRFSTRPPVAPAETYSALVRTTRTFGDIDFTVRVRTVAQLRPAPVNPWEVGWVLWRYADNDHFYSFIAKPDGWELAKQDAAYPGRQRFLALSYARSFPVGPWYALRVRHVRDDITVWVDGVQVVTFTDREQPYRSGSIALYAEDSTVLYGPVTVRAVRR